MYFFNIPVIFFNDLIHKCQQYKIIYCACIKFYTPAQGFIHQLDIGVHILIHQQRNIHIWSHKRLIHFV